MSDIDKYLGRIQSRDLMHRLIDELGEGDVAFIVTKKYADLEGVSKSYMSWKSLNIKTISEFWYEITSFNETFKREVF